MGCRIMRKVPDTIEAYEPLAAALLNDRHHGVLLTGVCLMLEVSCVTADCHISGALQAMLMRCHVPACWQQRHSIPRGRACSRGYTAA